MRQRGISSLYIQEKKEANGERFVILSKKINNFIWYSLIFFLVVISTIVFFRVSNSDSMIYFFVNIILVIIILVVSFFIFTYNKVKIKIIKNKNGDILIERLQTIMIKERIIRSAQDVHIYSKHIDSNLYGLKIRYKKKNSEKFIELELLPYYNNEKKNPAYLNKRYIVEIGKFLDIKVIFQE